MFIQVQGFFPQLVWISINQGKFKIKTLTYSLIHKLESADKVGKMRDKYLEGKHRAELVECMSSNWFMSFAIWIAQTPETLNVAP